MHAQLFRLKSKPKSEPHPAGVCSASRCRESSAVTYAVPEGPWPGEDVPLCDRHFDQLCTWQEDERLAAVVDHYKRVFRMVPA